MVELDLPQEHLKDPVTMDTGSKKQQQQQQQPGIQLLMRLSPPHNLAALPSALTGEAGDGGSHSQQQTAARHARVGEPRTHSDISK